jgi:hypothetical protein
MVESGHSHGIVVTLLSCGGPGTVVMLFEVSAIKMAWTKAKVKRRKI